MISVIICSIDNVKYKNVVENYSTVLKGESHEFIGIHDATSLCEGYNRGIARSRGNILIFSHDDIEILSHDFSYKLTHYLSIYDIIGVAGTTKLTGATWSAAGKGFIHGQVPHLIPEHPEYIIAVYGTKTPVVEKIQALDGMFFALNRPVVERVQFDENMFDGFHHYDLDFTFSAYLAGFKLAVCNDIVIAHHSAGKFDSMWEHYRDLFLRKHQAALKWNKSKDPIHKTLMARTREEVLIKCASTIGKE